MSDFSIQPHELEGDWELSIEDGHVVGTLVLEHGMVRSPDAAFTVEGQYGLAGDHVIICYSGTQEGDGSHVLLQLKFAEHSGSFCLTGAQVLFSAGSAIFVPAAMHRSSGASAGQR